MPHGLAVVTCHTVAEELTGSHPVAYRLGDSLRVMGQSVAGPEGVHSGHAMVDIEDRWAGQQCPGRVFDRH